MDLIISIIQTSLVWENRQANLDQLARKIEGLPQFNQLIVLPEMFSTGFTMNTDLAETMNGESVVVIMFRLLRINEEISTKIIEEK